MTVREIKPDLYSVGAIDWDRRLFDGLIPLPDGTSYNAYLIKGTTKTALVDTVDPTKEYVLKENLDRLGIVNIDFVISNHAEQDHSGALTYVLDRYKKAKLVTTSKAKPLLMDLLSIPEERFIIVDDGETLSLGNKTLQFIYTPWVHWPETMVTYLQEDKILFTCDLFGSHFASSDLYADEKVVLEPAKRYYAQIMMPFRTIISKNIEKIKKYDFEIIAPSHGPIYQRPAFIIDHYRDWVSAEPKNIVVLPYISMHGSTKRIVEYFVGALIEKGVKVKQFDLTSADTGKLALALVDAKTLVIGTPTVLTGAHPKVVYAAYLANALRPKLKFISVIGSFGWGGKMIEQLTSMISNLKAEILDPVVCKGLPKQDDFKALDNLAETIARKHKSG
ncbi:MAG: FprA family A-type flavoprotein [Actinobacteria bacterium]|nr:MAG: FprA family A-type flavoprotein [Actinomycetota bacterium]